MGKRSGRNRSIKPRQPNGQLKRDYTRDRGTPELAKRLAAMKGKGSPDSVTDQLAAAGLLRDTHRQAADHHAFLRARWLGRPTAGIAQYGEMIANGSIAPIVDIDASKDPQRLAQEQYLRGQTFVVQRCSPWAHTELINVIVDRAMPTELGLPALIEALDALHDLYFKGLDVKAVACYKPA